MTDNGWIDFNDCRSHLMLVKVYLIRTLLIDGLFYVAETNGNPENPVGTPNARNATRYPTKEAAEMVVQRLTGLRESWAFEIAEVFVAETAVSTIGEYPEQ